MASLLRFEIDLVKYGEVARIQKAIGKRLRCHFRRAVASIALFRCSEVDWAVVAKGEGAPAPRPLADADLQSVQRLPRRTMRLDVVFRLEGDAEDQRFTVRVVTVRRPYLCRATGLTFATRAELKAHKSALRGVCEQSSSGASTPAIASLLSPAFRAGRGTKHGDDGASAGAGGSGALAKLAKRATQNAAGTLAGVSPFVADEISTEDLEDPQDNVRIVRVYRCARADVAMELRPLPPGHTIASAERLRALSDSRLRASSTFLFWDAYMEHLADKPTSDRREPGSVEHKPLPGQVVTLAEEHMADMAPMRMEVPFCADLDAAQVFDEPALRDVIRTAAVDARSHCMFPQWFEAPNARGEYFEVVSISVVPLSHRNAPVPGSVSHTSRVRLTALTDADKRDLIAGDPFQLRARVRGKNDTFDMDMFVKRLAGVDAGGDAAPRFRVCKLDLGFADMRADAVWNIEVNIQIAATLAVGDDGDRGFSFMGKRKLPAATRTALGTKARKAMTALCILQRRCLVRAMRDVGLHVWDTSTMAPDASKHFFLVTAPPHVLAQRAQKLGLRVRVNPDPDRGMTFVGGFTPAMFLRGGPLQNYWVGTANSPHVYKSYFVPFTSVQRQQLVRNLMTEPRAALAGDDGALDLRDGGADLNPSELQAESLIWDFFPLHDEALVDKLNTSWVKLPRALTKWVTEVETEADREDPQMTAAKLQGKPPPDAPPGGSAMRAARAMKAARVAPAPDGDATVASTVVVDTRSRGGGSGGGAAGAGQPAPGSTGNLDKDKAGGMAGHARGGATGAFSDAPTAFGDAANPTTLKGVPINSAVAARRAGCCARGSVCRPVWELTIGQLNQPLDDVAGYFGTNVAWYFAWLSHYTKWLLPVAAAGLAVMIVRWVTEPDDEVATADELTLRDALTFAFAIVMMVWATVMLEYFQRDTSRWAHKWDVAGLSSDGGSGGEALGGGATGHRRTVPIRSEFIMAMQEKEERERSQQEELGLVFRLYKIADDRLRTAWQRQLKKDLEQHNELYYYPESRRRWNYLVSAVVCIVMILAVIAIMSGVLVLPGLLLAEDTKWFGMKAEQVLSGIANGCVIPILNYAYKQKVALALTDREMHPYHSAYQNSLVVKLFAFQFFNSYTTLFIIAFWFQDMERLSTQLAGLLVTGQIIATFKQHFLARAIEKAKAHWRRLASKEVSKSLTRHHERVRGLALSGAVANMKSLSKKREGVAEDDAGATFAAAAAFAKAGAAGAAKDTGEHAGTGDGKAAETKDGGGASSGTSAAAPTASAAAGGGNVVIEHNIGRWSLVRQAASEVGRTKQGTMLDEYLETVINAGLCSMFAPAWPMAPLAALVRNFFEIRLDGYKYLISRRPFAQASSGIGVWYPILQLISVLSVFTNVMLLHLSTLDANGESKLRLIAPSLTSVGAVWVVIALEHILVALKLIIRAVTSDVPLDVRTDVFREQYYRIKEAEGYAGEVHANEVAMLAERDAGQDDSDGESDDSDLEDASSDEEGDSGGGGGSAVQGITPSKSARTVLPPMPGLT